MEIKWGKWNNEKRNNTFKSCKSWLVSTFFGDDVVSPLSEALIWSAFSLSWLRSCVSSFSLSFLAGAVAAAVAVVCFGVSCAGAAAGAAAVVVAVVAVPFFLSLLRIFSMCLRRLASLPLKEREWKWDEMHCITSQNTIGENTQQ